MKLFNLAALSIFISINLFAQPNLEQITTDTIIAQLQKDIPVLMERSNVPGLSIAIVRNGKLVWSKGFGVMNVHNKRPVTNETVFECNSLSKPVFAYAVMRLVDESKLNLDTPIIHYMDSSWQISKDPRIEKVTPRMLLSQTSGIKPISEDEVGFNSSPGERWQYQPLGFKLLGKVVEKITAMTIEDYMYKSILQPLGMTRSSYVWMPMYDSLRVTEHDWQGNVAGDFFKWQHAAACCSLETTPEDYARFVTAVMEGKLLSNKSAAEMIQPQIKINEKFPSVTWGVGWGLEINGNEKSVWHWGHGENCKDYIEADLGKKNAVIFFANSDNGFFFTKEIIDGALRGVHFSTEFLDYQRYDSPSWIALQEIISKGTKSFLKSYKKFGLEEGQINNISYRLMNSNRLKDALAIFKLNIRLFPNSWNAYDSYGEALLKKGRKNEAIKMYKKSIKLNPDNLNGKKVLEKLLK